jgi:hypothetical protein
VPFWSLENLDTEDPLNAEIWRDSPDIQDCIQPYASAWRLKDVGAQQAMRSGLRLPWVPDLVGLDWTAEDATLVVGSAYGPFIADEHRDHEMTTQRYNQPTVRAFQQRFLCDVVTKRRYYARVAALASNVMPSCRKLALFDLCRVAFIRRDTPLDRGGDKVVTEAQELFNIYVERERAREWLWQRLIRSRSSAVVALGTIAEHGVLRLLAARLTTYTIVDSNDPAIDVKPALCDAWWASRHAHPERKLKHRKASATPPFWRICGVTAGTRREWRVAVVPHPTGSFGNPGDYPSRAISVIQGPRIATG